MRLGPERLAVAPEVIPGAVKASAIRSASFHGAHKLSSLAAASQARWLSPPNVCTPSPSRRRPLATQRPSLPRSCAASLLPCAPARLRRRLARQHLVTTASPPTAAAQHALAHQGRRPLRLHPPPRAPEVESHQVAHPQPPVGDVVHRLLETSWSPSDTIKALRTHPWSIYDAQYLFLAIVAIFSLSVSEAPGPFAKTFAATALLAGILVPATRQFLLPLLPTLTWLFLFNSCKYVFSLLPARPLLVCLANFHDGSGGNITFRNFAC